RAAPEPIPLISQVSGQSPMRIGTHNGTFHCDDVLVCFLLRQLPEYKVRDRNQTSSQTQTYRNKSSTYVVVDVGGEYMLQRYDHHQRYSYKTRRRLRPEKYCLNMKTFQSQEGFQKALALVGAEFKDRLHYYMKAWLPAREFVQQVVQSRYQVINISTLHCCCCPWKEHLFVLEKQLKLDVLIKFVLYPDPSGHWRVQCVPAGLNSFQNRLSLLEEWRGGIPGCIFVHASGFIGGNRTQEMAKRTLAPRSYIAD
uniref:MYG1 exonuclease n=1 Tax=Sinocyclocheilus anshuiensis TaxID=1608454 RepID=A0A671RJ59_9TELE